MQERQSALGRHCWPDAPPYPGVLGLVPDPQPKANIVAMIKHALLIMVTSN